MTREQAEKLKSGDRVFWDENPNDRGIVVKTAYKYIEIEWKNHGIAALHPNDCQNVGWCSDDVWERSEQEYDA